MQRKQKPGRKRAGAGLCRILERRCKLCQWHNVSAPGPSAVPPPPPSSGSCQSQCITKFCLWGSLRHALLWLCYVCSGGVTSNVWHHESNGLTFRIQQLCLKLIINTTHPSIFYPLFILFRVIDGWSLPHASSPIRYWIKFRLVSAILIRYRYWLY